MSQGSVRSGQLSILPPREISRHDDDVLAFRIAQVREAAELLLRALASEDHRQAVVIAERMRQGLSVVERTAFARTLDRLAVYDEIVTEVVQLQDEIRPLLDLAPRSFDEPVMVRRYLARMGDACLSRYRASPGSAVIASNERLSHLILKHADLEYGRLASVIG